MLKIISHFKSKKIFWISISILLIISGYFYWIWQDSPKIILPITNCDLRVGPCATTFPNGEPLCLRVIPTSMPILTSIIIEVKAPRSLQVSKMHVFYKGKNMNMGKFKYVLEPKDKNFYTAQTFLPTCIHEEMVWEGILKIDTSSDKYAVPFILINERPKHTK